MSVRSTAPAPDSAQRDDHGGDSRENQAGHSLGRTGAGPAARRRDEVRRATATGLDRGDGRGVRSRPPGGGRLPVLSGRGRLPVLFFHGRPTVAVLRG
ncbi:hypothetical protein [Streptomyces sp. NRRL S-481]|uniref:hypothetical protein n=1 Tax=Streptomyces sp. NRRL S-481 TaxID=1463911 RepID=UPI00131C5C70|nr:hypothetical protein [Streptomyces sp. NRRL S-481]